jgi:streptomycin 3"-adenylyltransferase
VGRFEFTETVAGTLRAILGESLLGVYLHGSGSMGGWSPERSDVDILAVAARPLTDSEKHAVSSALGALDVPGVGIEFSLVTHPSLGSISPKPAFELHVTTGPTAHVVDGAGHRGDPDLVLHYVVCRERGLAAFGPPPSDVFPDMPRRLVLAQLRDELEWAEEHAPPRYQVLNALRAWAYADDGRLLSKLEGAEWAIERERFAALARAAMAAQSGGPEPDDPGGIRQLTEAAVSALRLADANLGRD